MSNMLLTSALETVQRLVNAEHAKVEEVLQELWSGYGQLQRVSLVGAELLTVIVKLINWEKVANHPRGWDTDFAHQRKVNSYRVEAHWYRDWQVGGDDRCYLPKCLGVDLADDQMMIVLEDLKTLGFSEVRHSIGWKEIQTCLKWLAYFHAKHMHVKPEGLWSEGTYWHLATRPQELQALEDKKLKNAAQAIGEALKQTPFQTIVHGDAKLANFCFSKDGTRVAAVDFQYVGGGCGMKDVAYFIGSCLHEEECREREQEILDIYFDHLQTALVQYEREVDAQSLIESWRPLYRMAWADFHRFLKGWSPGHWKINSYSEQVVLDVINNQLS